MRRLGGQFTRGRVAVVIAVLGALALSGAPAAGAEVAQAAPPAPAREPVVLVPGWMGWPESMDLLAGTFRSAGYTTYVVDQNLPWLVAYLTFPSTNTTLNGPKLAATVDRALAETGAAQVDLVGYSYGGLVARHYVKDMGGLDKVRRYVGIGVPQRGVTAACGLPYEETGHLCPGTPFMLGLNGGDDTPGAVAYSNIWSDQDTAAAVVVDGAVCTRYVPGVPHLGEPFSGAVAQEALARLEGVACPAADQFVGTVPDALGP